MYTKLKLTIPLLFLLTSFLTACGTRAKFVAPEIEPPTDLIPGYVPEGFKLISGFELPGELTSLLFSTEDGSSFLGRRVRGIPFFKMKGPTGNVIQGIYYQGKDHRLLITKSYFPNGDMDQWLKEYDAAQPEHCGCECDNLPYLDARLFQERINKLQEIRTIDGIRVVIFQGPQAWTAFFVRGDYLLSVESGLSLKENLKIVASLLKG